MISLLNEISGKWFSYIADFSIQFTLFFVVVFFLSFLFRTRSAKFLYGLWLILLLKAILPPTIPLPFQKQLNFIPHISIPTYTMFQETTFSTISSPKLELSSVLFLIWCIIIVMLLGYVVWKNVSFRLKLRGAVPFDLNLLPSAIQNQIGERQAISVFILDNLCAPFTISILKPQIYLPADALKWEDKKLEAIVMHEIAHIKRKDLWVNLLQNSVQVFYFFHPFVWFANWQINNFRERACDDYAILHLNGYSLEYSKFLLAHLDRTLQVRECPALVNYFFQSKKIVLKRFEYLVQKKEEIMLRFKTSEKLVLTLLFFVAFGFTLANSGITNALPDNIQDQDKKGFTKITGKVIDKISKEAIPGANIFLVGTKLGAASNASGNYEIKNVPPGKYKISVQFLGYEEETQELTVEVSKNEETKYMLDFALERKTIRLRPRSNVQYEMKVTTKSKPGYGKIRGNVSANGEALPGANVLIIGTRYGSATDPMGNFLIMDVPPGVYTLGVEMIGFKPKKVKDIGVRADLTTEIDFQLETTQERPPTTKPVNGWNEFHKKIEHPGKRAFVSAEVLLEKNGKVTEIKLKQASGDINFDETVLRAIAETKWTPILKNGEAVKTWVTIPVRFKDKFEKQFVPYDTPPEPIGGFAAIQKNLKYPEIARRAGIEGTVVLSILINKEGEILRTEVNKSLGDNGCDEAAIDAVRKTRWNPAIRRDKPVQVWVSIPVIFKLKESIGESSVKIEKATIPPAPPASEKPMFVPYDKPPEPIGGFAAIQKNLQYPEIARRAGIQGTVILQVLIDTTGNVLETKTAKSLGENNGCDEAAAIAVSKTSWKPALQRDKPVKVWVSIPVIFKIKEQAEGLGKIVGVVKDSNGNPIKSAMVFIQGSGFKEYTDADGAYVILNIQPGKHQLICGTPKLDNRKELMERAKKLQKEMENPVKKDAAREKMKELSQKMREIQFEKKEIKEITVQADELLEINFVLK